MPSGFNLEITATCRRYDGLQLLLRALNAQTYSTAIQKVSLFPAPLSLTPVPQASHSVFTTNSVSRDVHDSNPYGSLVDIFLCLAIASSMFKSPIA